MAYLIVNFVYLSDSFFKNAVLISFDILCSLVVTESIHVLPREQVKLVMVENFQKSTSSTCSDSVHTCQYNLRFIFCNMLWKNVSELKWSMEGSTAIYGVFRDGVV